jgi:hypothetical protein
MYNPLFLFSFHCFSNAPLMPQTSVSIESSLRIGIIFSNAESEFSSGRQINIISELIDSSIELSLSSIIFCA